MSGWVVATLLALGWLWGMKRKPRPERSDLAERLKPYSLKDDYFEKALTVAREIFR